MARNVVPTRTPDVNAELHGRRDDRTNLNLQQIEAGPRLAFTIPEFCKAFRISEAFFYKLRKLGQGPREMKVGSRTLISLEAADVWRREREGRHEP